MEKPKTLQEAIRYFSDEQVCIDTVAALRWPDGEPTCPALGVTQKTASFMLHRLRIGLQEPDLGTKMGGGDGGEVDVDETFVGEKLKNMHKDRRARWEAKRGGAVGKTVVCAYWIVTSEKFAPRLSPT